MKDVNPKYWINPRDKPGLLLALMKELSGDASISFEGWLNGLGFGKIPGAKTEETESLKRVTIDPKLDFVVLPLNKESVPEIWKIIAEKDHLTNEEGIIHVQIEKNGELVFGGYDNFHKDCVVAYAGIPIELLQVLKERGIIRVFQKASDTQHRWHDCKKGRSRTKENP